MIIEIKFDGSGNVLTALLFNSSGDTSKLAFINSRLIEVSGGCSGCSYK